MEDSRYQVMPDLTEDEYKALKADIAARGVQVPIEFDEDGNVLDGHHRLRACAELGITEYPTITREGMTEDEKVTHAYRLNTARRHLTPEQTMMAVGEALRRFPDKSNREIATIMGISHPTVGKYRKLLEESGQVVSVTTRTGADGKAYSMTGRDEHLRGKRTFTCCICGEEFPALYVKSVGGKLVNSWGYDPWPVKTSGDCCEFCNRNLMDIRDRMPEEVVNEHYFGPLWRDVLEAADIASKEIGHDWDRQDEFSVEFDRLLTERGIVYDDKRDVFRALGSSTTRNQLLLKLGLYEVIPDTSDVAAALFEAAKSCSDVETLEAVRDAAKSAAQEYAALVVAAEKKEGELRGEV